jgi:hypothetical protein
MPGGNWPAMSVVDRLERELGKPVLANNAVSLSSRRAPLRCRRRRLDTRARRIFPRSARKTAEAQAHCARRPQFQDDRLRGLHRTRDCGRDRQEQFAGCAGGARARIDRGVPPQRGTRSRTHEARRMALHAVASGARVDARHFSLGAIGQLVAQGGRGLGMDVLVWGRKSSLEQAVLAIRFTQAFHCPLDGRLCPRPPSQRVFSRRRG